jgi:hypothetical protein
MVQQDIKGKIVNDYMEHIAPALENVLKRFNEIHPDNKDSKKSPKFLTDFYDLVNKKLDGWLRDKNPEEQQLVTTTLFEHMNFQVANFLQSNPKAAAMVEKIKVTADKQPDDVTLTPEAQTAEHVQQTPAAAPAPIADVAATPVVPAVQQQTKEKGKRLKALQDVVKAGGAVLGAFFSYKPPKIVTDVSNLTEFALGVIFGAAKGTIQKLREESQLAQNLQKIKSEVTNDYLADISPKLSKAFERYDEILSTPDNHPLLTELNKAVSEKMQQWTSGKTAEEKQFISKTFDALLHSQTSFILTKNPELAQRVSEDRSLLQAFGIPAEAIHPDIAKAKEWTPDLALQTVKEDGNNLKHIPEQLVTQDLCNLAIAGEKGKGEALQHVPEKFKTPMLCDAAMEHNPAQAFLYVPDSMKTPKMCDKAVTAAGENLQHVPKDKISRSLCETAIKNLGKSFAYVPADLRDASLCLAAVRIDGTNLQHVPQNLKTKPLCMEAQKNTSHDIQQFFPEKFAPIQKAKPSKRLQAATAEDGGSLRVASELSMAPPLDFFENQAPFYVNDAPAPEMYSKVVAPTGEGAQAATIQKAKPSKRLQAAIAQIDADSRAIPQQQHKQSAMKIA